MRLLPVLAALILGAPLAASAAPDPAPEHPSFVKLAPGVWSLRDEFVKDRQPDGTTVIFEGPKGLVVFDTGRHAWRRKLILDFAVEHHAKIAAIVNSHWHLDHVSGNPDLKRAYPGARVYASRAIDDALTGFLKTSAADGRKYLGDDKLPAATLEDLKNDLATIDNGQALRPDVPVERTQTLTLAGRKLKLNLAPNAATDGDIWIYDPATRVAAVGDLVTLPAPFLDTACPEGWRAAMAQVWATPFTLAVPGHGAPMSRAQFAVYRKAFSDLVDCSASSRDRLDCAGDWAKAVESLGDGSDLGRRRAKGMANYYVGDVLRAHGGKSASCKAK